MTMTREATGVVQAPRRAADSGEKTPPYRGTKLMCHLHPERAALYLVGKLGFCGLCREASLQACHARMGVLRDRKRVNTAPEAQNSWFRHPLHGKRVDRRMHNL